MTYIARLRISGGAISRTVLLPYSSGLGYFVVPTGGPRSRSRAKDFRAELLGVLPSLWVRLRLALLLKKKKYLRFEDFSLFSFGVKSERKRFTTFNQQMFNAGLALDGDLVDQPPGASDRMAEDGTGRGGRRRFPARRIPPRSSPMSFTRTPGPISPRR